MLSMQVMGAAFGLLVAFTGLVIVAVKLTEREQKKS